MKNNKTKKITKKVKTTFQESFGYPADFKFDGVINGYDIEWCFPDKNDLYSTPYILNMIIGIIVFIGLSIFI